MGWMPEPGTTGEATTRGAAGPSTATGAATPTLGWARAGLLGAGVFVYFVVAATWLPSTLLRLDPVASSSQWIRDGIATGSWLVALSIGLFGLRWAQAKGWI